MKVVWSALIRTFFGGAWLQLPFFSVSAGVQTVSSRTRLRNLLSYYPDFAVFVRQRFGVCISERDHSDRFGRFVRKHNLPPEQILFMEFQLHERSLARAITARALKDWMDTNPKLVLLDVREPWEREWGSLPRSIPLDGAQLKKVLGEWPKDSPLAVICHYGIRSLDAAHYLADQGFQDVKALQGGLEAWSEQVDPTFPQYAGEPCA